MQARERQRGTADPLSAGMLCWGWGCSTGSPAISNFPDGSRAAPRQATEQGPQKGLLWGQGSLDLDFDSWFVFSPKFYPTSAEMFVFNEPMQIPVPIAVHQLLGSYI